MQVLTVSLRKLQQRQALSNNISSPTLLPATNTMPTFDEGTIFRYIGQSAIKTNVSPKVADTYEKRKMASLGSSLSIPRAINHVEA